MPYFFILNMVSTMSRKKTYVASVTQRLLSDEDFRTSSQYGISRYIQEQKSIMHPKLDGITIGDTLVDAINASMPSKMRKAYKWASKEGNYEYGMPISSIAKDSETNIETTLMNHLRGVESAPITLINSTQNSKNMYHAGWMKLVNMLGYSGINNELKILSLAKGHKCYLFDGLLELTEETEEDQVLDGNINQIGLAMTYGKCFNREEDIDRIQQSYILGTEDKLTITYSYKVPNIKPNIPMVNVFNNSGINGYADIGSIVRYTDNLGVVQEVNTDSSGLFEFTALSETTVSGTFISLKDSVESSSISHVYPYVNSTPITEPLPLDTIVYEDQVINLSDVNPKVEVGNDVPDEFEYIQAVYKVGNEYKWFSYAYLSGGIPALDGAVKYTEYTGNYFPRFYVRQDGKDLIEIPKTDEGRKDTEKLFKKIEINLKDITETINKGIGDSVQDVKYSFLQMCVSINKDKDNNATSEYIFQHFMKLHGQGKVIKSTPENTIRGNGKQGVTHKIADNIYTQEVSYNSSWVKLIPGIAIKNDGTLLEVGEYCVKFIENGLGIEVGGLLKKETPNIHVLIHQISATDFIELSVEEITLKHMFYGQLVTSNGNDEDLTIPLDYDIAYGLKTADKENLMNKSLQLTVTSLKVVKQKWYQTGIFKFAMAAISIAINIIVPGSGLTLMAILQAVAVTVVTGLVVNVAISLLVKFAIALGISADALLGLIAVLVVAAVFVTAGSGLNQALLTAKNMMKVMNTSFDIYSKHIQANIAEIKKNIDTFNKYATDQWTKLKETQKLLDTGVVPLDLELLTRPVEYNPVYFGESAEDFYTRTTTVDMAEITSDVMGYFLNVTSGMPVARYYKPERSMEVDDVLLIN